MTLLTITWDGALSTDLTGFYVERVMRGMHGGVRDQFVSVPGRDGGWVFPERRGWRRIVAECTVVASTIATRHAAIVSVADWLDRYGELQLIFSDQSDRYWLATVAADPNPDEWRRMGRFQLEWLAQPYAYAISTTSTAITASGAGTDTDTFAVSDTIEAYPVIELTPLNGTLTGFSLTMNGDTLTWAGSAITSGNTITISSIASVVVTGQSTDTNLTGAYTVGLLTMNDVTGDFPLIIPGTNTWTLSWTGTATSVRMDIEWRRRYR